MKKTIILLIICTFQLNFTSGQSWYWGKAGYSTSNFGGFPVQFVVATDSSHNAYVAGAYASTIQFGSKLLTDNNDVNAYLVKYDSAGNVLWAVQPSDSGISSYSCASSVALDKFGNIFLTGTFHGTISFGNYTLTGSRYYQNAFIAKYSPSGNVLWAKQPTPLYFCLSYAVATDDSGDAYITGFFTGKISFGSDTVNNPFQSYDMFLVKYDSAGNVLWAKQGNIPSATSAGWGYSLATDKTGNAYVAGLFEDTISLDSATLLSPKTAATFIAKYSPAGNLIWAKQSINNSINSESWPSSIILNNTNNLYITGFFVDAVHFGSQSLYSPSTNSVFIAKYDTGGNFVWAEQSSVGWYGGFLASDNTNHIYLTGETDNNPDTLKFGSFQLYPNPAVGLASFLIKFDSAGKPICGSILNDVYAQGIASDQAGNYIYTTGTFYDTLQVGGDTLFGNDMDVDIFTGRWQNCAIDAGVNTIIVNNSSISLFPNPNNGAFTLSCHSEGSEESNSILEIYNVLGEKVYTETLNQIQGDNTVNISNQTNGIYLYRVLQQDGSVVGEGKLVIQK